MKTGLVGLLVVSLSCLCLCGCGTFYRKSTFYSASLYPATKFDLWNVASRGGVWYGESDHVSFSRQLFCIGVVTPLFLLDLPISVATDTMMMPFDLYDKSQHEAYEASLIYMHPQTPCEKAPELCLVSTDAWSTTDGIAVVQVLDSGPRLYVRVREGSEIFCATTRTKYRVIEVRDRLLTLRKVTNRQ
jgi:uncharacterized protein YceK